MFLLTDGVICDTIVYEEQRYTAHLVDQSGPQGL